MLRQDRCGDDVLESTPSTQRVASPELLDISPTTLTAIVWRNPTAVREQFTSSGAITEDEDFYPWGGEVPFVTGDSNHYKFTSEERDAETGLDYFRARYYGYWLGRFSSADPRMLSKKRMLDPQQWNMYTYVRNNPLVYFDPDGKELKMVVFLEPHNLGNDSYTNVAL